MAKKNGSTSKEPRKKSETKPKFPYTTKPGSLRKFLQQIPQKPKPPKIDQNLLKSWGYKDANDYSMVRVLKSIGLLNGSNEPTELYSQFMHLQNGADALADPIRRIYEPLFNASHEPFKESPENLQNLFNIHSGGSDRAIEQQIQTFKALCENTSFDGTIHQSSSSTGLGSGNANTNLNPSGTHPPLNTNPTVNINLHIHLPENKSSRDYEAIIEDIGRYIFGNNQSGNKNE